MEIANLKCFFQEGYELRANTYLLDGKPLIQIDAGIDTKAKPDLLILTHCHVDHIFLASKLQKQGTKIMASESAAASIRGMEAQTGSMFFVNAPKPFDVDEIVSDGQIIENNNFKLRVIETPGHEKGAICLFDEKKGILFSGDTWFGGEMYGRTDLPGGDDKELQESVKKIKKLPIKVICPGHEDLVYF